MELRALELLERVDEANAEFAAEIFARETRAILLTRVAAGITKSTGTTQSACLLLGVPLAALVTNSTRSSLWQAATGDDSGFGSFEVAYVGRDGLACRRWRFFDLYKGMESLRFSLEMR